jgi:hypothetical protein
MKSLQQKKLTDLEGANLAKLHVMHACCDMSTDLQDVGSHRLHPAYIND